MQIRMHNDVINQPKAMYAPIIKKKKTRETWCVLYRVDYLNTKNLARLELVLSNGSSYNIILDFARI